MNDSTEPRPDLFDRDADPERWSNHALGDKRLTWRELAEQQEEELRRLRQLAQILADLDRCEHGRHEGDPCSGCGGPSLGNPIAANTSTGKWKTAPRQIGFTLSAGPIVVPEGRQQREPNAWMPKP